jgi:hypothetical protein
MIQYGGSEEGVVLMEEVLTDEINGQSIFLTRRVGFLLERVVGCWSGLNHFCGLELDILQCQNFDIDFRNHHDDNITWLANHSAWDAIQKQAKNKPPGESSRGRNNFKSKSGSGSAVGDANNGNEDGDENGDGEQDEEEEEEEEEQLEEQEEEEEGMDLDKERDDAVRSRPVEADQGNAGAGIDHEEAAEEGNVAPGRGATEDGDDVTMASEPED